MASDTASDKVVEQTLVDVVNASILELQEACKQFASTMEALTAHESDTQAHPDIRELITDVVSGTGFILEKDAISLITKDISEHNGNEAAHPALINLINTLSNTVNLLTNRVLVLETDGSDSATELQKKLEEVSNTYDPLLKQLMDTWTVLTMQNKTDEAASIAMQYSETSAMRAAAVVAIMEEYS